MSEKTLSPEFESCLGDEPQDRVLSEELLVQLVKLRKKRKIGQAPIAEALGMSQSRVSQIENLKRNVHLETVLVYARAVGCKIVIQPDSTKQSSGRSKP